MRAFTGLTRPRAMVLGNEFAGVVQIHRGQDVLVYGETGAIGSAAVQLVKSLGANVTAVCEPDNLELVRGLGADKVVEAYRYVETGQKIGDVVIRCADGGHQAATDTSEA